jgi:hypothetical protein
MWSRFKPFIVVVVVTALGLIARVFRYGDPEPGAASGTTYVKDRWTGTTLICGLKDLPGGRTCLERSAR